MKKFSLICERLYIQRFKNEQWFKNLKFKVRKYVEEVYDYIPFEDNKEFDINGFKVNSRYIDNMINNQKLYNEIILIYNLNTKEKIDTFIRANLFDIYNCKSKFCREVSIPLLIGVQERGDEGEKNSFEFVKEIILANKGVNIEIEKASDDEDLRQGIDGKFRFKSKWYSIQVKPFNYTLKVGNTNTIKAKTSGALKLHDGVNYLVLYNYNNEFILLNQSDVTTVDDFFIFDKDKIIAQK